VKIQPRSLSAEERAVLDHLLSVDFEGADVLRRQAVEARVVGRCDCGCPTIDIETSAPSLVEASQARLAPVEGRVVPRADEPPAEVLLFLDGGRLSCLELVWYGEAPPSSWPTTDRVELVHVDR
jgi:hypothetical protein